ELAGAAEIEPQLVLALAHRGRRRRDLVPGPPGGGHRDVRQAVLVEEHRHELVLDRGARAPRDPERAVVAALHAARIAVEREVELAGEAIDHGGAPAGDVDADVPGRAIAALDIGHERG